MRKYKVSREGSKKFISAVLALELFVSAIGFSSCSKKNVEVESTTQVEVFVDEEEDNSFEETADKIKELNLDLSEEAIKDATIVLLLSELAKKDENGKISAKEISKYKTIFDADATLEEFDNLLSEVESEMLRGNFVSISSVLPDSMKTDKAVLGAIESIAKEAMDNKDNAEIIREKFIQIYNLFVKEETVNDFELRRLDYSTRAAAYSYAREVMYLARNYISDEDYNTIDKRTNDQSSRSELIIKLEILENDFVEISDGKAIAMFDKKYEDVHDLFMARVKSESNAQKKLVNYLNIKYLFKNVITKDREEILGIYDEDDIKEVMELVDAVTLYNAEEYKKDKNTNNLIPLSMILMDQNENDKMALDYMSMASMEVISSVNDETSYEDLEANGYYDLMCAVITEKAEYKYTDSNGTEQTIKFNWHEMSDGVKLTCFEIINYTFGKMNDKIKNDQIFKSYKEVMEDMLFREIQYIQDTLDECKRIGKSQYVKSN